MASEKDFVFSNISLQKNKAYMMYIGTFRYNGICDFFIKPLTKYYHKKTEVLYIFTNFPPPYFKGQFVVINHKLKKALDKQKGNYYASLPHKNLNKQVSHSAYVKKLIKKILLNQKDLFINPYMDTPELTLPRAFTNIKLLGPQTKLFAKYDSKLFQHELIDHLNIPQPKWFLAQNKNEVTTIYTKKMKAKKVFVSKLHSSGGKGCAIVSSKEDILNHEHIDRKNCKYIVAKFIHAKHSPTAGAIVANNHEVFFCGIMDQILEGPTYLGTIYPSIADKATQKVIEQYTKKIGKYLGEQGYRGFFNLDFLVDRKNKVYFSEINPRMGGSTLERVYMHEITKEKNALSLPELELMAITKNTFGKLKAKKMKKANFSWGVLKVKAEKGTKTIGNLLPECSEFGAFKEFKTTVLGFPANNVTFLKESNFCKIVSVKLSRKEVEKELKEKAKLVLNNIQ